MRPARVLAPILLFAACCPTGFHRETVTNPLPTETNFAAFELLPASELGALKGKFAPLRTYTARFSAHGTLWSGVLLMPANGPDGIAEKAPSGWPLPGAPKFGLLGKWPNTPWKFLGSNGSLDAYTPSATGETITLRINDDVPGNGSGGFLVDVAIVESYTECVKDGEKPPPVVVTPAHKKLSDLYLAYFDAACTGCHKAPTDTRPKFSDAHSLWAALEAKHERLTLADATQSIVIWCRTDGGGSMPKGATGTGPSGACADIKSWVDGGANDD